MSSPHEDMPEFPASGHIEEAHKIVGTDKKVSDLENTSPKCSCGTICGLVYDERFNRHVCPMCLIKERDAILRRMSEQAVNENKCDHKLAEHDYTKLNQTAVAANGICTVCGEQPT